jgi:hypothetical protein
MLREPWVGCGKRGTLTRVAIFALHVQPHVVFQSKHLHMLHVVLHTQFVRTPPHTLVRSPSIGPLVSAHANAERDDKSRKMCVLVLAAVKGRERVWMRQERWYHGLAVP